MSKLRQIQRQFAARIRDPEAHPGPADVAPERMQLYERLFHRNVQRLLANAFPRAKAFLGEDPWRELVRDFFARHASVSPYFRELGREFLTFLGADECAIAFDGGMRPAAARSRQPFGAGQGAAGLPDFLLELAHYEWTLRALRDAEDPSPEANLDAQGDLLSGQVVVSSLAWPLSYRHPVQVQVSEVAAQGPPPKPTFLIARRLCNGSVKVLASNPLTHRLLALLAGAANGRQALDALAAELPEVDGDRLHREGVAVLERLRNAEVLLGVRVAPPPPAS